MKIYIIVNEDRFFLSHRMPIALAAQEQGHEVTIVCKNTGRKDEIVQAGLRWIDLPINPTGTNLREELRTLRFLARLYQHERPDLVHHVGLKNVLWGTMAAHHAHVNHTVNAIAGLGVLFSGDRLSMKARMVLCMLRMCSNRRTTYIFQNSEDRQLFIDHHVTTADHCEYIKGSGVDLQRWTYTPEPANGPIRIIFTARMVREKGIETLCQAARLLQHEMEGRVEFLLCGDLSNNPRAISRDDLEALCQPPYIQWLGYRADARQLVSQSHIMAFPSHYREGVPLSLIEAAALGRPIVTTNSIGCRDTVDDGVNGFLVPPHDPQALADKLRMLINDADLRKRMGKAGREKAEKEFSLHDVVQQHLEIYTKP